MKRLALVALSGLLVLGLLGCSPDEEAALVVNGREVLTVGDLEDQLEGIAEDEDFLTNSDGRGEGTGNLSAGFVAAVLSNHVLNALIADELSAADEQPSAEDEAGGSELLAQQVGGDLETIPAGYRETLLDLFVNFTALVRVSDGDELAAQERANQLLLAADVDVADRYGSWDTAGAEVAPPEGAVTPSTVPLPAPVPLGG